MRRCASSTATRLIDRLSGALGGAVDIQIDIFWAVVGGADPAEVIGSLGSRVVSLHLKDGITLPPSAYGDAPFVNVPVGQRRRSIQRHPSPPPRRPDRWSG